VLQKILGLRLIIHIKTMALSHSNYLSSVLKLERMLFPKDRVLFWHYDDKTKKNILEIIQQLKELLKYSNEIDEQGQKLLVELDRLLIQVYADLKHGKSKVPLSPEQVNERLEVISRFFIQRYELVNSNKLLRYMFKKLGCELLFKRRVDTKGPLPNFKGPAILAFSHHQYTGGVEHQILQALVPYNIHFINDLKLIIKKAKINIRIYDHPFFQRFGNKLGQIEVNRGMLTKGSIKGLSSAMKKAVAVLEYGGLIGIAPAGWTEIDSDEYKTGHSGVAFIAWYGEKITGRKIPIIPIGIKKKKSRFIVNFGNPVFIPNGYFDRKQWSLWLWDQIESLAK
jgi:1-acyl-sn-glycerol-3-phosphate acyltransferase